MGRVPQGIEETSSVMEYHYGDSPTCSLCGDKIESISHLYCCQHPTAVQNRQQAATAVVTSNSKLTPVVLVPVIARFLPDSDIKPDGDSSFESVAQCQLELGSHAFCRGHVCTPWLEVYMIASGQSRPTGIDKKASNGVVNLVRGVWQYTMAVYFFRNATVHGKLPQFPVGKSLQQMRDEAATVYEKFTNDPHGILSA
jgi:hypothetical protein